MNFLFQHAIIKRIRAIPHFLRDKTVKFHKKLIVIFGILYCLSPIDLIPAPVLLFGIIDDLVIGGFILYYFSSELDRYWLGEKPMKFKGKKIIEGVDYKVNDGKE